VEEGSSELGRSWDLAGSRELWSVKGGALLDRGITGVALQGEFCHACSTFAPCTPKAPSSSFEISLSRCRIGEGA
jgi:hypothetical protein